MDFETLVQALSRPGAYPGGRDPVEVRRTHISVAFLVGARVYKIKRPLRLDFLDYSTPEKRRRLCEEEVRLNRRLAPEVYEAVVPITRDGDEVRVEGEGTAVEHAVRMKRLPDEARLLEVVDRHDDPSGLVRELAAHLARFHAGARRDEHVASFARFEAVAGLIRANFDETRAHVGTTVAPGVFRRLRDLSERELERCRDRIEERARRGVPCEGHGDLRLEHVYRLEHRFLVIDCVEFSEAFRDLDPVADMAFLAMDLALRDRRRLARELTRAYARESNDAEGLDLGPLYTAYRAVVRAKVQGIKQGQTQIPEEERRAARDRAQALWLLALERLAPPDERPGLVLMGGLPGTGKTTLARGLAEKAGFTVVRSDVVRKRLAGDADDLYTDARTERTYRACLEEARSALLEGGRIIVDATFRRDEQRVRFLDAARRLAVPAVWLVCETPPPEVRRRLRERSADASDADWRVYEQVAAQWEPPGESAREKMATVRTGSGASPVPALTAAMDILRRCGLTDR